MNNTPTRGSNTLDISVTHRPYLFESCDIVSGNSGHETLLVKSLVTACISYSYKRTIYLWSWADFDVIKNILYRISSLCEDFTTKYTHPHLMGFFPIIIVYSNISKYTYLQNYEFLCDEQHAWFPFKFATFNHFAECLNKGSQCGALSLDFSNAFDKLPHSHLYQKTFSLRNLWTHISLAPSISNQYIDFNMLYTVDDMESHAANAIYGVPQGIVLATLMYIIDLPLWLYADDVLLFTQKKTVFHCSEIWILSNGGLSNGKYLLTQCEFLRITNKNNPILHNYHIAFRIHYNQVL